MTNLRLRPGLGDLPVFRSAPAGAGGIKLDSNELAFGPLPGVRDATADAVREVNRYPDNSGADLTRRLAETYGLPVETISLGPGSVGLCMQLLQITCEAGDEVIIPWRSFEVYPTLARTAGAVVRAIPLTPAHKPDLVAMAAAITDRTRLVFVCTPNNPTGTVLGREELERFFDAVPGDVLVVLDEAYWEFVGDPDALDGIAYVKERIRRGRHNVVALRTFSKAYGLAGVRVGYCVSAEPVADMLARVAVPYAVNTVAQRAAVASLACVSELRTRVGVVALERERTREALVKWGYEVPPSGGNFLWLPLGEASEPFRQHCLDRRIRVRALAGEGVRVTVGEPHENDELLAAADTFPAGRAFNGKVSTSS
ncbi:histidinol-phosphate transaminase [Streptomyces sp. NPDC052236]|uniref:histidinol-phosphate transaminase n=1 Tax=Streptomyces sp. NPDC052236 TaxID=3365686 RepID=UPI0037D2F728